MTVMPSVLGSNTPFVSHGSVACLIKASHVCAVWFGGAAYRLDVGCDISTGKLSHHRPNAIVIPITSSIPVLAVGLAQLALSEARVRGLQMCMHEDEPPCVESLLTSFCLILCVWHHR